MSEAKGWTDIGKRGGIGSVTIVNKDQRTLYYQLRRIGRELQPSFKTLSYDPDVPIADRITTPTRMLRPGERTVESFEPVTREAPPSSSVYPHILDWVPAIVVAADPKWLKVPTHPGRVFLSTKTVPEAVSVVLNLQDPFPARKIIVLSGKKTGGNSRRPTVSLPRLFRPRVASVQGRRMAGTEQPWISRTNFTATNRFRLRRWPLCPVPYAHVPVDPDSMRARPTEPFNRRPTGGSSPTLLLRSVPLTPYVQHRERTVARVSE